MHGKILLEFNVQVRVKPSIGYQREDIRISGNRVGILDVNNRSKIYLSSLTNLVKEEFECNEIFTPEQTMARIFDSSVLIKSFNYPLVSSLPESSD